MPVVIFSRKYLSRLVGSKIDVKQFEDHVAKMGFELSSIEGDSVTLEITPNRPDLFDAVGFARAYRFFTRKSEKFVYQVSDPQPALQINVGDRARKVRPYISALVALNAKLGEDDVANLIDSSEKFCDTYGRRRRKIAMGMHNLNAVKGPVFYDAYGNENYVPLNQASAMSFDEVLKSTDKGIAYANTIANGKNGYPALTDKEGIMSLIPILNSERTKITKGTKNILVDITGTSEHSVNKTADLFAATFMDLGCDVKRVNIIYSASKKVATPLMKPAYLESTVENAEAQLGVALAYNNVISLANRMGYEAALLGKKIRYRLPEYRLDLISEQDVIEDIAIAYGYDYIQPLQIYSTQKGSLEPATRIVSRTADAMVGLGYSEAMNSYLTNEKTNFESMRMKPDSFVRLRNPKAASVTMMRTWLLPSLLKNVGASVHEKMPQNLFEIDNVFYMEKGKPVEALHLGAVSTDSKANFNTVKSAFEEIVALFRLNFTLEKAEHRSFIDGRCAGIVEKKKGYGFLGEMHPEVLSNFGIEEPTVALEIEIWRD